MGAEAPEPGGVNRVAGLLDFVTRWERGDERGREELRFVAGDGGNINLDGTAACNESVLLTHWHPSFGACLEAGVRDLIMRLVADWDCVTYSSCEGHRSSAQVPARVRHVRLLARSEAEHARLEALLARLVAATNDDLDRRGVTLAVRHSVVVSDDGVAARGLDLVFEPDQEDEARYWEALEAAYARCIEHVGAVVAEPSDGVRPATTRLNRLAVATSEERRDGADLD